PARSHLVSKCRALRLGNFEKRRPWRQLNSSGKPHNQKNNPRKRRKTENRPRPRENSKNTKKIGLILNGSRPSYFIPLKSLLRSSHWKTADQEPDFSQKGVSQWFCYVLSLRGLCLGDSSQLFHTCFVMGTIIRALNFSRRSDFGFYFTLVSGSCGS